MFSFDEGLLRPLTVFLCSVFTCQAREGLVQETVAVYLNRLSDFLFVAARFATQKTGGEEVRYKKDRVKKSPK